jgi:flagellar biosynthetic protein FliR
VSFAEAQLATYLCAFARSGAWLMTAPLVSDRALNPRLRTAIAALLAIVIAPLHPAAGMSALFARAPGELMLGVIAGFTGRIALFAAETGGQIIGINLGLGSAALMDPDTRDESLPTRRIAYSLAGIAFLSAGGLERSIGALAVAAGGEHSLAALPLLIDRAGEVMILALRAAAPMLVAAVVSNLAVGLASRAAPAMNIFSVMLAATFVVGALVLTASAPSLSRELAGSALRAADGAYEVALVTKGHHTP